MENKARAILAWVLVLFYGAFMFFLSSMPQPLPAPVQTYFPDWIFHGIEYGLFGFLLGRALFLTGRPAPLPWLFAVTLFFGGAYALSDEWHQSFVAGRQASARDIAADIAGTFLGVWLWARTKIHA